MARLKPVADQIVVVMGASSGIGREAARRFAAAGARVVASAWTTSALASRADEITAAGRQVVTVPALGLRPDLRPQAPTLVNNLYLGEF